MLGQGSKLPSHIQTSWPRRGPSRTLSSTERRGPRHEPGGSYRIITTRVPGATMNSRPAAMNSRRDGPGSSICSSARKAAGSEAASPGSGPPSTGAGTEGAGTPPPATVAWSLLSCQITVPHTTPITRAANAIQSTLRITRSYLPAWPNSVRRSRSPAAYRRRGRASGFRD